MDSLATTQTLTSPDVVIVKEDFFTINEIENLWHECRLSGTPKPFIDQWGVFKGQLVADQLFFDPNQLPYHINRAITQAQTIFGCPTKIVEVVYQQLHLPWDIHCDLECNANDRPYYNLLIPFHNVESRTVVFNQRADEHDAFWKYKQANKKLQTPVDQETWDRLLSMCWDEDREYLSIYQILPVQKVGQLVAFDRHHFHCSDSFHLWHAGTKHFLQVLLDKA